MRKHAKPINVAILIKLREAMLAYERRTSKRMTHRVLAELTGLSEGTLHNIASRRKHGANLATLAKICFALEATPGDLMELVVSPSQSGQGEDGDAKPETGGTEKK